MTEFEPVCIGPTWKRGEDGKFILPEFSLGWHMLDWTRKKLVNSKTKGPWLFTNEQARFLLWYYAVDENFQWLYREAVFQRLKGHGKDPVAAAQSAFEFVGPCQPTGELAKPGNSLGIPAGQPIGEPHPNAWVQIAAVSQDQTRNTFKLFPSLFSRATLDEYQIDLGKTVIYAHKGAQTIEAVTSSPRALEGGRPTFIIANETHHWLANNGGHDMWDVIERNATKADDDFGAARALAITNAYQPGEDSIAERRRDAIEAVWAGDAEDFGLLYDSLEAPPEAPLTAEAAPAVVEAIRGDSVWLNTDRIVKSILDTTNPPSRSRRFWYNQIVANEDSWVIKAEINAVMEQGLEIPPRAHLALFFDGSKSDDNTGLVACEIETGNVYKLGLWIPSKTKPVDREAVSKVVHETHEKYRVVGFFADPGSGEDETGERYWDRYIDEWSNAYGHKYVVHPVQSGMKKHSIMWPMSGNLRMEEFTHAVERCYADIVAGNFKIAEDAKLRQHILNAKRRPNDWGVSIGKRHRMAREKIDLAICMVGARMVRRLVLSSKDWGKKPTGKGRVIVLK